VVLLFDGDDAGQRAALRALEVLLPQGLRVSAAALPEGLDPDDLLAREGPEALRALVDGAVPALEIAIRRAVAAGCRTPWERADAVAAVAPLLAAVPDPVERGEFARRLALMAGTAAPDVESAVRRLLRPDAAEEPEPGPARRLSDAERHFAGALRMLLDHPAHAAAVGAGELLTCPPDPVWAELAGLVLGACSGAERVDVATLSDRAGAEARRRLTALAARPLGVLEDAGRAERALRDTLAWLRRHGARGEARALTARLGEPGSDGLALLQEKQRQLERRRSLGGVAPG
jgi:DNA primase